MHLAIINGELFGIKFTLTTLDGKKILLIVGNFKSEDGSGHRFNGTGIAVINNNQHFYCSFYYDNLARTGFIDINPATVLENANPQTRLRVCNKIVERFAKIWSVQPSPYYYRLVEYALFVASRLIARDLVSEMDTEE